MGLRSSHYIESPLGVVDSFVHEISDIEGHHTLSYNDYTRVYPASPTSLYSSWEFNPSSHKKPKHFVTYGCRCCRTHLSASNQIMSKNYRGKTGDAYLMSKVINITEGKVETRPMITGDYIVCDILCHWCKSLLGWKYLNSSMPDQQYKEGKYILELETICVCD